MSYEINGKKYPRVSKILSVLDKPGLNIWRAKLGYDKAREVMKESQEFGSEVHNAIETTLRGQTYRVPKELKNKGDEILSCRSMALHFLKHHRLTPIELEHIVYSKYGFAGTLDLVALDSKDRFVLVDWKTGSIYRTAHIQLTAYKQAYQEMSGKKISKMYVVCVGKGQRKKPKVEEVDPTDFSHFVSCLKLYRGLYE